MTTRVNYTRPASRVRAALRWLDLEPGTYFVFDSPPAATNGRNLFIRIPEGYVKLTDGGGNSWPSGRLNREGDFPANDADKPVRVVTRLDITPHFDD